MNHSTAIGYAGVDWAVDRHAVCVVDPLGVVMAEFEVLNTVEGLGELCRRIEASGALRVAIERPDGPVVDAILGAGLEVVVVSSRSVKALRTRYGTSGNKCDRSDAYILADCLRTDGHRWRSLEPDSPATMTVRGHVRARKDLVETRVAVANQLRAHLRVNFPGAVGLFSDIDNQISLRFLRRFPSASMAARLTQSRLATWLQTHHYTGRTSVAVLFNRLQNAPRALNGDDNERSMITLAYVEVLTTLCQQINELEQRINDLLDAHPDAHIYRSLPRCATIRAATLLAEIGDCRARFPDPQSLANLAGVSPSTKTSGRHRTVTFRYSSDKQLRNAICDFAGDSRHANLWAARRYQQLRAAGKTHQHATRILGRTWTTIIWHCWQNRTPYDPHRHGAHQALINPTT